MENPNIPLNKDLTYIGYSTFRDKNTLFRYEAKRPRITYILGKSGTGKSVLMSNMMMQNIINGEGVCVVDPHERISRKFCNLYLRIRYERRSLF